MADRKLFVVLLITFTVSQVIIRVADARKNVINLKTARDVPKEIFDNINTPNNTMSSDTILMLTTFLSGAYHQGQTNFNILRIYLPEEYGNYPKCDESGDNIQLIYTEPDPGSDVGHLICVHYKQRKNKVYIFDPSYRDGISLNPNVRFALETLYPSVTSGGQIEFVRPGTLQPDRDSCGYISVAVLIALMFRINPEALKLKLAYSGDPTVFLRQHMERMFLEKRITPFPTVLLYVSNTIPVPSEVIRDVITPYNRISGATMIKFIEFVNDAYDSGQIIYEMLPIISFINYEQFPTRSKSVDDIQIIHFGHYLCVHYDHLQKKVSIYDPLYHDDITLRPELQAILEKLYPSVRSGRGGEIVFVRPGTILPQNVPPGLFAIVFATALIFQINPKHLKLRLVYSGDPVFIARQHLEQMFCQRRITLFPTELFELTVSNEIHVSPEVMEDVRASPDTMIGETIDTFNKFVINACDHGQTFYKMFRTFSPRNHGVESRDDIQIIESEIGEYFFCVHYNHLDKILYIYDPSDHNNILDPEVGILLRTLYPSVRSGHGGIVSFASIQAGEVPSGLFSIAVATALVFGIDPKYIKFQSPDALWQHLEQIFREKKITPFPMVTSNPTILSNRAFQQPIQWKPLFQPVPVIQIQPQPKSKPQTPQSQARRQTIRQKSMNIPNDALNTARRVVSVF